MPADEARIERIRSDRFRVSGSLTFDTVTALLAASEPVFAGAGALDIDLQGVQRADSAGLALLIEWMRRAHHRGLPLRFLNMPPQMLAIARASSLDHVLPLARERPGGPGAA
ncbi:MAG: STAS domain-containing protein [Gammaproteobacteria bacterium]|nr:MAG: STAS domain-containing protein [Gammaproteobacteria bacterium]